MSAIEEDNRDTKGLVQHVSDVVERVESSVVKQDDAVTRSIQVMDNLDNVSKQQTELLNNELLDSFNQLNSGVSDLSKSVKCRIQHFDEANMLHKRAVDQHVIMLDKTMTMYDDKKRSFCENIEYDLERIDRLKTRHLLTNKVFWFAIASLFQILGMVETLILRMFLG